MRVFVSKPDVHESVHRDIITKTTNKMQLCRLIYYSLSALHVSGDVFGHHQEHLTVFTRSVNKVMRLIQYKSVLTLKLQIEFVPFKIVPLGGYTPPETLFPLFVATLVVANRNRF